MNRAQRLGLYSIQTSAFLSGNLAAGQVVYTDIDPDIVLDTDGAYCGVDVNQDGVDDFGFLNFEFAVYSDSRSSTQLVQELLVGPLPLSISNKIAGQFAIVGGFTGTIYFEIPYALKWNVTIGSELSWQEDNIQQLAAYVGYEDGGGVFLNCHWANEHNHNNLEAYIGIQFHDQNNLLHYGWIRCVVKDSAHTYIIKDYAYEATPKKSILAGQMPDINGTGGVVNLQESTWPNTSIYAFGQTIYVHTIPEEGLQIGIMNMQGQLVYQNAISLAYTEIPLQTLPSGVYQVVLQNSEIRYLKQVYLIP